MDKKEFNENDVAYMPLKFGLWATVKVIKKRSPYGRHLYLIKCLAGKGEAEVESSSLFTEKQLKEAL